MDYYQRLDVAEMEGDLLKAMKAKDAAKAADKVPKAAEGQIGSGSGRISGDAVKAGRRGGRGG